MQPLKTFRIELKMTQIIILYIQFFKINNIHQLIDHNLVIRDVKVGQINEVE